MVDKAIQPIQLIILIDATNAIWKRKRIVDCFSRCGLEIDEHWIVENMLSNGWFSKTRQLVSVRDSYKPSLLICLCVIAADHHS